MGAAGKEGLGAAGRRAWGRPRWDGVVGLVEVGKLG